MVLVVWFSDGADIPAIQIVGYSHFIWISVTKLVLFRDLDICKLDLYLNREYFRYSDVQILDPSLLKIVAINEAF